MTIPNTMRAAVLTGFGGPENVAIEERPVPEPRDNEILVRMAATTINSADTRIRTQSFPKGFKLFASLAFGFTRPRIKVLGVELAGTVVATGRSVTRFAVGDEIIAMPGIGTHQQFRAIAETRPIVKKPADIPLERAAALCFGGTTALQFLRKAWLQPGERILVIGATGTVGSAMVQLARHMGAEVIAAASAANMELARSIGATHIIDYRQADYIGENAAYDVIADTVGATSLDACFEALRPGGRFLAIAGGFGDLFKRGRGGKRQISGMASERADDIALLARLAQQGVYTPLIDSTFSLSDIAAAHARAASGLKRGSVLVMMD